MKNTLVIGILLFVLGAGIGWYFGYTRPLSYYARNIKSITGMTDQELAEAVKNSKTAAADVGLKEGYMAAMNLGFLQEIESGDVEAAKARMSSEVVNYYNIYSKLQKASPERSSLLARIENTRQSSAALRLAFMQKNPQ